MTPFCGELYVVLFSGDIVSPNIQLVQRAGGTVKMEKIITAPVFEEIRGSYRFYLVESEGDLLLVMYGVFAAGQPVVYRVDTENRSLHAVGDIGSRSLFVNLDRSISVDTRVHPTVEPGCIYYTGYSYIRLYNHDIKSWDEEPQLVDGLGRHDLELMPRPYRLDQILAAHCRQDEFAEYVMQDVSGADAEEIYRRERILHLS